MALSKFPRSPHSPSPIFGIRPGFTVGDFDRQYTPPMPAIGTGINTGTGSTTAGTSLAITTAARAVKVSIIVASSTPTDHVDVTIQSAMDAYGSDIATYANLTPGTYQFYLGGWSSPSDANSSYVATQYGPSGAVSEATSNLNPATDNNYVGGTYNPFQFLSLDGYSLKATSKNFSGSPTLTVSFDPLS